MCTAEKQFPCLGKQNEIKQWQNSYDPPIPCTSKQIWPLTFLVDYFTES